MLLSMILDVVVSRPDTCRASMTLRQSNRSADARTAG